MILIRKSVDRGHADHGWLDTYHTFSFADYQDPRFMGFRTLRVINEDRVKPAEGFGTHPHRDMEIITYVLKGGLEHKDSMGNGSVIRPGEIQLMSAGTGVTHSEYNHSQSEDVHLLQIWVLPAKKGVKPRYEQHAFDLAKQIGKPILIISRDGREKTIKIYQDVDIYATLLSQKGETTRLSLEKGRYGWIQVVRGVLILNGEKLKNGDGAAIENEENLEVVAQERCEFLFFDLG